MDGIHDLGGKEGYGPIDVDEPEVAFHEAWEGRMWAISRIARAPDWTIDWWRHVRELIVPTDYLARPYFDSWAQTHLAAFIDSGIFTLEEGVTGKCANGPSGTPPALTVEDVITNTRSHAHRFDRETDQPPAYKVGDEVRTNRLGRQHHTRLPEYVRGKRGRVHAHHGAHVFPDLSARGEEVAEHLYSVAFEARELWHEGKGKCDRVFLDLWESYLEPA